MSALDFGDRASGRVIDENTLHVTRPPRFASGIVVGLFPAAGPRYATVQTRDGSRIAIKVTR